MRARGASAMRLRSAASNVAASTAISATSAAEHSPREITSRSSAGRNIHADFAEGRTAHVKRQRHLVNSRRAVQNAQLLDETRCAPEAQCSDTVGIWPGAAWRRSRPGPCRLIGDRNFVNRWSVTDRRFEQGIESAAVIESNVGRIRARSAALSELPGFRHARPHRRAPLRWREYLVGDEAGALVACADDLPRQAPT